MAIKLFAVLLTALFIFNLAINHVHAIENPFSSFNNKVGIHILFPDELHEAAKLVNSNGGDWGYVIIPIQSGEKDIVKWQKFFDDAKRLHVIPIIRLATEGDYFNTKVWRKPKDTDIIDFANFLSSLDWPIKNRYIVVFNEVNRADEWGGSVNADEYARLLSFAANVFKSKSQDFFIISAGLDNAAPNKLPEYQNQYDYLREMNEAVPGIFNQIDGLSSHSYPNPAFAQPPTLVSSMGITSFDYERKLIKSMSTKNHPIFITETGWSANEVSDLVRADYYQHAFKNAWSDRNIVAVTPFLLKANGQFTEFSFFTSEGAQTLQYQMVQALPKVKGLPALNKKPPELLQQQKKILSMWSDATKHDSKTIQGPDKANASEYKKFAAQTKKPSKFSLSTMTLTALNWLIGE
jgi:hypothetical protein